MPQQPSKQLLQHQQVGKYNTQQLPYQVTTNKTVNWPLQTRLQIIARSLLLNLLAQKASLHKKQQSLTFHWPLMGHLIITVSTTVLFYWQMTKNSYQHLSQRPLTQVPLFTIMSTKKQVMFLKPWQHLNVSLKKQIPIPLKTKSIARVTITNV